MAEEMKYLTFRSQETLNSFLKRKTQPVVVDKVEFYKMERYDANRVLFTAEHAVCGKTMLKGFGRNAYAGIGDFNTDILVKLACFNLRSAYIMPRFIRTRADASRPPEDLGKGLRLFTRVKGAGKHPVTYVAIHKDPECLQYLQNYHSIIDQLNPRVVVSVHGMSESKKSVLPSGTGLFDVLFGFGEDFKAIGGKKEAFRFKDEFSIYLDQVFNSLKMKGLDIAIARVYTGSRNYVLTRHVIEFNKSHADKRIGMQIELNFRGRTQKGSDIPTLQYQIFMQALGDFILKWMDRKD